MIRGFLALSIVALNGFVQAQEEPPSFLEDVFAVALRPNPEVLATEQQIEAVPERKAQAFSFKKSDFSMKGEEIPPGGSLSQADDRMVVATQLRPYTLQDYVEQALKQSPLVQASEYDKKSAEFSKSALERSYLPQLTLASHSLIAPTRGYDPAITNGGEWAAQLELSYLVYDGGLKGVLLNKSGILIQQQRAQLNVSRADVTLQVSLAFAEAVREKRELAVLKENAAVLKDYFRLVKDMHAAGQAGETDVLKTEVQLNNILIAVDAKESALQNALAALEQTAGFAQTDTSADVDTAWFSLPYDTAFEAAGNLDITSAKLQERAAELEAKAVQAQLKPNFILNADAGALTSNTNLEQRVSNIWGGSVGASLSFPLFTFNSVRQRFHSAQFTAKGLAERNRFLERSLASQFNQAHNNARQGEKQITALERNLKTAGQNLALSKAKYAGGSGTSIEVLDAIQLVTDIRMALEAAKSEVAASLVTMRRLNFAGGAR